MSDIYRFPRFFRCCSLISAAYGLAGLLLGRFGALPWYFPASTCGSALRASLPALGPPSAVAAVSDRRGIVSGSETAGEILFIGRLQLSGRPPKLRALVPALFRISGASLASVPRCVLRFG